MSTSRPQFLGLLDYLESAAAHDGVVHFVQSGEHVLFRDLWTEARRKATWLAATVAPGEALAAVLEPTRPCLATVLGTWLAGRTLASLPRPARAMGLTEYGAQVKAELALVGAELVVVPRDLDVAFAAVTSISYDDVGETGIAGGDASGALAQFTSGSTGKPRGVVVDMANIGANAFAIAERLRYDEHDVFFSWLPLSHDMGLIGMCMSSLAAFAPEIAGARHLWLTSPEHFIRNPASWLQFATDVGGSVTMAPNFALDLATRKLRLAGAHADLSSLRCLALGSETVQADTLRSFLPVARGFGFSEVALCPGYGLAEATLAVTLVGRHEHWSSCVVPTAGESSAGEAVSLGRSLIGTELRVDSDRSGVGEVQVRGPSVAARYLGREPPLTVDGWLRTGDLGMLRDGALHFAGRSADRIVIAGRNIDSSLLQHRIGQLAGVRSGCCAVVEDDGAGFAIVIEPADDDSPDLAGLCREVADSAASIAGAVPARVVVLERGQLPKTPSGKLQRGRLRNQIGEGALTLRADVRFRADHGTRRS